MAIEVSPVAIQANSYSAELFRRGTFGFQLQRGSSVGSVAGGVVSPTDLQVTYGGSGLGVSVSVGEAIVPGSSSTTQSGYYVRGSSTSSLTPAAANATNPRVDLVYLQVNDAAYVGASNSGTCSIATGTPSSGASLSNLTGAPTLPTSSLALAYVLVPANASTISNTDIGNVSTRVGLALNGQDSGWQAVSNGSMSNSWINGTPAFRYRLQGNVVRLGGQLLDGNSGQTALTLPAGYRPTQNVVLAATYVAANDIAYAQVTAAGALAPAIGAGATSNGVILDTCSFTID